MRKLVTSVKREVGDSCLLTCRLLSYILINWKVLLMSEISGITV